MSSPFQLEEGEIIIIHGLQLKVGIHFVLLWKIRKWQVKLCRQPSSHQRKLQVAVELPDEPKPLDFVRLWCRLDRQEVITS